MPLTRLKPAVPKHWLIAIAGAVWSTAGGLLCRMAWQWLHPLPPLHLLGLAGGGLFLAFLLHRGMLARIARRNMTRIASYADRGCVFAFQAWRSYFIILLMIALGSFLRHTALPREPLAVLYSAMGLALLAASVSYYAMFWHMVHGNPPAD